MKNKYLLIGGALVITVIFLGWLFIESSKPLPGQRLEDEGRDHVDIGTEIEYKTNPPTSGKHYADWVKPGIYSEPKDDRNLIHSLEHGYVIMSYNCDKLVTSLRHPVSGTGSINNIATWITAFAGMTFVDSVYAHGLEEEAKGTDSTEATGSTQLSKNFTSEDCHKLVDSLITIYEKRDKKKLLIVPRPNLDTKIALTAWNYLDKFDPSTSSGLSESDITRIERFIDAHLDKGPEQTMEAPGT